MFKRLLTVLIMLMLFALSTQAFALATAVPDGLRVSVWPEHNDNQALLMEGVYYPSNIPLPIEVKMAIPKGATVVWAGELAGGDISQDIQAAPKINPKAGYDEVVFTLTKYRVAQVEAKLPNALVVKGQDRNLTLDWVQQYPAKQTIFVFKAPSQASDIKMSIPETAANTPQKAQGFRETDPMTLAVGQKQSFSVTYKRSTNVPTINDLSAQAQPGQQQAAPDAPATGGSSSSTAMILLVVIGAAVVVFVIYLMNKHRASESSYEDDDVPVAKKGPGKSQAKGAVQAADAEQARAAKAKASMVAMVAVVVIVGVAVSGAVFKSSGPPAGDNCGQNIEYLQKGVDKYKEAYGVYPTDLKQLLESKDGKGPFAEKVDYKCPTEGAPYIVLNGVVQQAAQ